MGYYDQILNSTITGAGAGAGIGGGWGALVGGGMGLMSGLAEGDPAENQIRQQQRLNELQIRGNKELANYSQNLQKDMWNFTNYENQIKHLKAAGLNPALMYAKGGVGGQTGSANAGQVAGAHASSEAEREAIGIQRNAQNLQTAMNITQMQNIKADTKVKEAEAEKISGVDTENVIASTNQIIELTENTKAAREGIQTDNAIKELKRIVDSNTVNDNIEIVKQTAAQLQLLTQKLKQEVPKAGEIAQATLDNLKKDLNVKDQDIEESKRRMEYMDEQVSIAFEQLEQANIFNLRGYRLEIFKIQNETVRNATYQAYYELEKEYREKNLEWDKQKFTAELGGKVMARLFNGYKPNKGATPKFGKSPAGK